MFLSQQQFTCNFLYNKYYFYYSVDSFCLAHFESGGFFFAKFHNKPVLIRTSIDPEIDMSDNQLFT